MSVERKNGYVTPGSIAAKCCKDCAGDAQERDALLRDLHQEIAALFTSEQLFSHEIAEVLAQESKLDPSVSIATRASFIRKAIAKTVEEAKRRKIRSDQRAQLLESHRESVSTGRDKYMRKVGMFVWEADETEVLRRMMHSERYLHPIDRQTKKRTTRQRARHCNMEAMLDTLQYIYPDRGFTKQIVESKLEYLRSVERKKAKAARASDRQTQQAPQVG